MFVRNLSKNLSLTRVNLLKQRSVLFSTRRKTSKPTTSLQSGLYADSNEELMQAIQESPWALYKQMVNRIEKWGSLTPMPEFRPAVKFLQEKLEESTVKEVVHQSKGILEPLRIKALQELFHISIDFSVTSDPAYPHAQPFMGRYPYLPTIHAIANALSFIDVINRQEYEGISVPYHTDRYRYHLTHMYDLPSKKNGKFVYLPLSGSLYLRDFIKCRPVPLGFLGVLSHPIYNDAYWNGVEDFFFHDANHIRRLTSYNQLSWKNRKPLEAIQEDYEFITQTVLHAIERRLGDSDHEQDIKKLMSVLLFELFHEYAYAMDPEQLKSAFEFKSGQPSPFEHIIDESFNAQELEKLRLPNSNLNSGFTFFKSNTKEPSVRYFMDRGPNFIASCLNKLTHCFYDHPSRASWSLPKRENRTVENIAKAAHQLADIFFQKKHSITYEQTLKMAADTKALEVYPGDGLPRPKRRTITDSDNSQYETFSLK